MPQHVRVDVRQPAGRPDGREHLAEARDAYPADLSTGYKRAVAIARALAAQPQCILYDEPTTMVDPIMSDHLSDLMLRLKKGVAG